jgi:hypothetical protein
MRTRATVAGLTSSAAPMAASVQPGPASPWLAFNRIRAWVSALAGAMPQPIMVCSRGALLFCQDHDISLAHLGLLRRRASLDRTSMRPNPTLHKSQLTGY